MTTPPRYIAVVDIGKTNAKFAIVDSATMTECAVRKTSNTVLRHGPYPHFDMSGLWSFLLASLGELNTQFPVDAISFTTHGASAALVKADGTLAMPVLDYEHYGPDETSAAYDTLRPPFNETFSPKLPNGLNLGAQIFWLQHRFEESFSRTRHILMLPQYWAMRLTGVAASEATSLGCHTDLWNPATGTFSSLVDKVVWRHLFPPVRSAFDNLGPLLEDISHQTGVKSGVPVYCGIHDSNASLLAHLIARKPPFSVVSTGTWVVILSCGGDLSKLDPARDCLANSDAFGRPVASARFMGGREYAVLTGGNGKARLEDVEAVLDRGLMLLPSIETGSGPFPGADAKWLSGKPSPELLPTAVSIYLGAMTATSLALTGSHGTVIVEGPFASNPVYLAMLQVATGRPVLISGASSTGTAIGAALLALGPNSARPAKTMETPVLPARMHSRLYAWYKKWQSLTSQG